MALDPKTLEPKATFKPGYTGAVHLVADRLSIRGKDLSSRPPARTAACTCSTARPTAPSSTAAVSGVRPPTPSRGLATCGGRSSNADRGVCVSGRRGEWQHRRVQADRSEREEGDAPAGHGRRAISCRPQRRSSSTRGVRPSSGAPRCAGVEGGLLYALDATTGKELWNSAGAITSSVRRVAPSGGDSQVYVVTPDRTLSMPSACRWSAEGMPESGGEAREDRT